MSSTNKGLRRVALAAVSTLVVIPAMAAIASATPTFAFDRLDGINRYETSVDIATQYGTSANVILANGDNKRFPDSLTASYLAGEKNAPIMLTKFDTTPPNVLARIAASGAKTVYLVGGEGVISLAQEAALDVTYTVVRLGGLDRYLTAEKVIGEAGTATSTTAVLATGTNFPDAIAGGPLSYVKGMPLAITLGDRLPEATLRALKAAGTTNVIVLGGPDVVSQAVLATLATNGITLNQRIFGANRSETSSKLAEYLVTSQGFTKTGVNVASGYRMGGGADALAGGPLSGKEVRPTLITENVTNVGPGPIKYLKDNCSTLASGHIFGGPAAVSAPAEAEMQAAARCVLGSNQTFTVTPATAATLTLANEGGTTPTADDRTFSATGLTNGTTYRITLVNNESIRVAANGQVSFLASVDANSITGFSADLGTDIADITSVNNVAQPTNTNTMTITPVGGNITFTIDGVLAGSVTPVLYINGGAGGTATTGGTSTRLEVQVTAAGEFGVPVESFGVGGTTTFIPAEAANGDFSNDPARTVTSVDKVANSFVASRAAAGAVTAIPAATFNYDANDSFTLDGVSVGLAAFEAALSTGDTVTGIYTQDPAGVSVFNLLNGAPVAPTSVEAEKGTGASTNDITVTVVVPAGAAFDSIVIQRAPVTGGTDDAANGTVGTFVTIAQPTTDAVAGGDFQYVDNNLAAGAYQYRAALVKDGDQGPFATDNNETATTPVVDTIAPTAADTRVATNGGSAFTLDTGDTFTVAFSEVIAATNDGDSLRLTDADGTVVEIVAFDSADAGTEPDNFSLNIGDVTIGGIVYGAGRVLTVTRTAAATVVAGGTLTGLDLPATISLQSGTTDANGNAWNLAGSADRIVDTE